MSTIAPARRATRLRLALPLLLLAGLCGGHGVASAQDAATTSAEDAPEPVELTIANRLLKKSADGLL